MNPYISIIICTYNREKYIKESVLSILNQKMIDLEYELIIVNNNSTDKTHYICQSILANYPTKKIIYYIEKRQGLSVARNKGIELSNGEIIVFIDDDAMARTGFLQEISSNYQLDQKIHASGGRIYPKFESKSPKWMSKYLLPLMSVLDKGKYKKQFKGKSYPIGANMAFRKSTIDKIGLFNTKLGRSGKNLQGGEEKDIFNRMRKNNMGIYYLPDVCVDHIIPDSRLHKGFIKRIGLGIGSSEKIRSLEYNKTSYSSAIFMELCKWVASLLLFGYYTITFRVQKGVMIVKFRKWVTQGLITEIDSL